MNIDEKLTELNAELEGFDDKIAQAKEVADAKIAEIKANLVEETKSIKADRAEKVKAVKKLEGIKAQLESIYS